MSAPFDHYEDPLQGALNELVSAMSALNMKADPVNPPPVREPNSRPVYLSESDNVAKHAMEHLHAVFDLINKANAAREGDRRKIYRLESSLRDLRKTMTHGRDT